MAPRTSVLIESLSHRSQILHPPLIPVLFESASPIVLQTQVPKWTLKLAHRSAGAVCLHGMLYEDFCRPRGSSELIPRPKRGFGFYHRLIILWGAGGWEGGSKALPGNRPRWLICLCLFFLGGIINFDLPLPSKLYLSAINKIWT